MPSNDNSTSESVGVLENFFDFRSIIIGYLRFSFTPYRNEFDELNVIMSGGAKKAFWLSVLLLANIYFYHSVELKDDFSIVRVFPYVVVGVGVYFIINIFVHLLYRTNNIEINRYYSNLIFLNTFFQLCFLVVLNSTNHRVYFQELIYNKLLDGEPNSLWVAYMIFSIALSAICSIIFFLNSYKLPYSTVGDSLKVGVPVVLTSGLITWGLLFSGQFRVLSGA